MNDAAIVIDGVSKRYRLGARRAVDATLRDALGELGRRVLGRGKREPGSGRDDLWALRNVTAEVRRGEVLGIIGANGAGKSTLLKILSRITDPSAGEVRLRGRVGSLLEVGTGFHPELSGRENIYLNGAILGMRRAEIRAKFDDIVEFSGIGRFLDTPVKRYSSGMYVRLAFAVAAHLEPEILIVDEVLAVGDTEFQSRCLGRMKSVAGEGRTVLFVSHNMKAVRSLCDRAMLLERGEAQLVDRAERVCEAYLRRVQSCTTTADIPLRIAQLPEDPRFRLVNVTVSQGGVATTYVGNGEAVEVTVEYQVMQPLRGLRVYFDLCDEHGDILIRSAQDDDSDELGVTAPGRYVSRAMIPADLLSPRSYTLVVRGSLFDSGSMTGDGVPVVLHVQPTSRISRAHTRGPTMSKLQPYIAWKTRSAA